MQHFTRRETVILTRTSPGRLAYLAKIGIVIPWHSEGDHPHQIYYSWEQILELRTIRHLRRQVSLQMIRKILNFLDGIGSDRSLRNKNLVIANGVVTWVQLTENSAPTVIQVAARANRHVGQLQLTTLPTLEKLVDDIWQTAHCSKVIDFESFRQRVPTIQPD